MCEEQVLGGILNAKENLLMIDYSWKVSSVDFDPI